MIWFREAEIKDIDYIIDGIGYITYSAGLDEYFYIPADRLAKDLFSEDSKASAIIIEYNGELAGMALYSTLYDVEFGQLLHIDQAFIEESYRGMGIFMKLLEYIESIAKENGISHLSWLTWPEYEVGNKIYEHILKEKAEVYNHYYKKVK